MTFRKATDFLVAGFVLLTLLLLAEKIYPLGMPQIPSIFYRKNFGALIDFKMLFFAFGVGLVILALPRLSKKLGAPLALAAILVLTVALNLFIYRPMDYSWSFRVFLYSNSTSNPFLAESLKKDTFWDYPGKHIARAKSGYAQANLLEKRLTTYPPGLPLFYKILNKAQCALPALKSVFAELAFAEGILERPSEREEFAIFSLSTLSIIIHMAALALIPLLAFFMTRELNGSKAGLQAAAASALIPSFHIFQAKADILFPALGLFVLFCCAKGIKKENPAFMAIAGVSVALGIFLSFAFLPILLMSAVIIVLHGKYSSCARVWTLLCSWCLGGLAFYFLCMLMFNYNAVEMFFVSIGNNREFYLESGRGYWMGLFCNALEFLCFSGCVWLLGCFVDAFSFCRIIAAKGRGFFAVFSSLRHVFAFSFIVVFMLLLFSGGVRSEVSRNWMILMPLPVICVFSSKYFSEKQYYIFGIASLLLSLALSFCVEQDLGFLGI